LLSLLALLALLALRPLRHLHRERLDDAHSELRGGEDARVAGNDGLERAGIGEAREDRELHEVLEVLGRELDRL
jgi:hypothetical protein